MVAVTLKFEMAVAHDLASSKSESSRASYLSTGAQTHTLRHPRRLHVLFRCGASMGP